MTEEESYDLTRSAKKLGQLYPILKDKRGNIIDGFHRQNADPDWPTVTLESVDSDQKLELARLASNFCRRTLKEPEFQNKLKFLVGKCGMKPEEIADETGIHISTIYDHMPPELIDQKRSELIKEGMAKAKESRLSEISSTIQDMVECSNCHMGKHPNEIKEVDGKPYCLKCAPFVKAKPVENIQNGLRLEKPTESWAYRKAIMTPQHSKMEEAILQKLDEAGIRPVVTDRSFCLTSTTPDFYFPTLNLAVYLDGPVHEGKEDRDEELTDLLEKRHQVRVCRIKYSGVSDKEQTRVLQEIKEKAKA